MFFIMQALWEKAGKAYQQFSKSPPVDPEFCLCVSNVGQNEVLEALIQMAERIRVEKLDTDEIINGVRSKRSPVPAKMYNTFNAGQKYEYFYSDFKGKQALSLRQKRSPKPEKMYNTFNGSHSY